MGHPVMVRRRGRELRFLALALAATAGVTAVAAAAPPSPPAAPPIDEGVLASIPDLYRESSVVYAASRRPQPSAQAPADVTVVTAEEIRRYGWRTLSEVLRGLRGFYVRDDRAYAFLGVRGFLRSGDLNTRILFLIDGHRTNDNIFDQAMVGEEFPLDLDLVERVEVVRGAGTLYGISAFHGVINVVTKAPERLGHGELTLGLGTFDTLRRRATWAGTVGSARALVSWSRMDSPGRDFYFPEYDDPTTNFGWARGCDGERAERFFTQATEGRFTLTAYRGERFKAVPTGSAGLAVFNDPRNTALDTRGSVALDWQRIGAGRTDVTASLSYDWVGYDGDFPYDDGLGNVVINHDTSRGRWLALDLGASRELSDRHRVSAGLEVRKSLRQQLVNYDVDPYAFFLDSNVCVDVGSLYVEDAWTVRRDLTLYLRARNDKYEDIASKTSPRLALVYTPRTDTTWKLMGGESFRAPNSYERFYADGLTSQPNPDLQPELAQSLELSWERRFDRRRTLQAAVFRTRTVDLISWSDASVQYLNIGGVDTQGLELEYSWRSPDGHELTTWWTWQEAEDSGTGLRVHGVPRLLGAVRLGVPLQGHDTTAGVEVLLSGPQQTWAGELGMNAVTNLTVAHRSRDGRWEGSLGFHNLFDRRYGYEAPAGDILQSIPAEGRTLAFKVLRRF